MGAKTAKWQSNVCILWLPLCRETESLTTDSTPLSSRDKTLIPAARAMGIAGISRQRLWYWEKTGLVAPSVRREISERNIVRLYSLNRLAELVVAARLADQPGISTQHVREVLDRLRAQGYEVPGGELRFAVDGNEIYFQHPDGTWEGSRQPDQTIIHRVIDMKAVRATIRQGLRREESDMGRLERRRKVLGSKPVFAGTRVPLEAVQSFLDAGKSDEEILRAYPELSQADLEAARRERGSAA